jgi:hypothetical protein
VVLKTNLFVHSGQYRLAPLGGAQLGMRMLLGRRASARDTGAFTQAQSPSKQRISSVTCSI